MWPLVASPSGERVPQARVPPAAAAAAATPAAVAPVPLRHVRIVVPTAVLATPAKVPAPAAARGEAAAAAAAAGEAARAAAAAARPWWPRLGNKERRPLRPVREETARVILRGLSKNAPRHIATGHGPRGSPGTAFR